MNGFLDTTVIVRYLVREPADQAEEAVQIIDGDRILYVTPVILAETALGVTQLPWSELD